MMSSEEYEVQPYIRHRRVVADMIELAATMHQMKGGLEIDVTFARESCGSTSLKQSRRFPSRRGL